MGQVGPGWRALSATPAAAATAVVRTAVGRPRTRTLASINCSSRTGGRSGCPAGRGGAVAAAVTQPALHLSATTILVPLACTTRAAAWRRPHIRQGHPTSCPPLTSVASATPRRPPRRRRHRRSMPGARTTASAAKIQTPQLMRSADAALAPAPPAARTCPTARPGPPTHPAQAHCCQLDLDLGMHQPGWP